MIKYFTDLWPSFGCISVERIRDLGNCRQAPVKCPQTHGQRQMECKPMEAKAHWPSTLPGTLGTLTLNGPGLGGIHPQAGSSVRCAETVKLRLHVQFFPCDANAITRNYCIAVVREKCTCSMSCTGDATSSKKLPKYCKLLIFWQLICQQILPSHCVTGFAIF